jgi:hypothetical protein
MFRHDRTSDFAAEDAANEARKAGANGEATSVSHFGHRPALDERYLRDARLANRVDRHEQVAARCAPGRRRASSRFDRAACIQDLIRPGAVRRASLAKPSGTDRGNQSKAMTIENRVSGSRPANECPLIHDG